MTAEPHGRALTAADDTTAKLIRQSCTFAQVAEEKLSQSVLREEGNLLFKWTRDADRQPMAFLLCDTDT